MKVCAWMCCIDSANECTHTHTQSVRRQPNGTHMLGDYTYPRSVTRTATVTTCPTKTISTQREPCHARSACHRHSCVIVTQTCSTPKHMQTQQLQSRRRAQFALQETKPARATVAAHAPTLGQQRFPDTHSIQLDSSQTALLTS